MNIVLFVSMLNLYAKTTAVNVAQGKTCTFCGTLAVSAIVTNGDPYDEVPETISAKCNQNAYLDVDLIQKYYVQRVWIKSEGNQFDFFVVKLLVNGDFVMCTEYPQLASENNTAVCRFQPPSDKVRIETRGDDGMILYEIEVHSEGEDGREEIFHEGCFSEFEGEQKSDADIYECRKTCANISKYFGMKNRTNCFCGNSVLKEKEMTAFACKLCAPESSLRCGNEATISVYKTENRRSYYFGCIENLDNLTSPLRVSAIKYCILRCTNESYMFYKPMIDCQCSDDEIALNDTNNYTLCDHKCLGMVLGETFCGGTNAMTVYKTCYYGPFSGRCKDLYHCYLFDASGYCQKCYSGYTGYGCVNRFLDRDGCWLPNVCSDQPNTTCKEVGISYICECNQNLIRYTDDGLCEENICWKNNFCIKESNAQCARINGSYECTCIKGYERNDDGNCEITFKEMACPLDICADKSNSECERINGKFECICLQGFEKNEDGNCIVKLKEMACTLDLCADKSNSECKRINGKFECVCLQGFEQNEDGNCTEMACPLDFCPDNTNSQCEQINGKFECVCSEGFKMDEDENCFDRVWTILGVEANYFFYTLGFTPLIILVLMLLFICRKNEAQISSLQLEAH